MPPIFYLGPEGTFSHILARKRFGKRATLQSCPSIDGIFEGVRAQPDALGLVPIENSSGGTVYDSVDLLIRHAGHIFVQEELALDVRIALLGRPGPIKTVYSHFTQIKHHTEFLKARYPQARLREVSSTAVAAQKAAAGRQAAALASPGAAEVYGLEILEKPHAGPAINVTNFFTISGAKRPSAAASPVKTSLVAALPNTQGSLHGFLGPFARQKVSLTRIISRPVPGKPQTYVFYVEIEGGPAEKPVATAIARATALAESLINLGTYPLQGRYKS